MTGRARQLGAQYVCAVAVVATVAMGCEPRQITISDRFTEKGLVIVLPGIDGRTPHNEAICRTVVDEGVEAAVELYDWTTPLDLLGNQTNYHRNRRVSRKLASRIVRYREDHPNGRVVLIGHSAGTGIAVWAAEALPDGMQIDRIVMLASSLSPTYDLSKVLGHLRNGIVSFYSARDIELLGAGTTLFGTVDRKNTEAAGKVGFQLALAGARGAGVRQIAWQPRMSEMGYHGDHFSCCAEKFIGSWVLPLISPAFAGGDTVAALAK